MSKEAINRAALMVLLVGCILGPLLSIFTPVPIVFAIGVPVGALFTAGSLYRLSQRPKGWHAKHAVETFDRVYRPLKPLKSKPQPDAEPEEIRIDPDKLRAEIEAMKRRDRDGGAA